MTEQVVQVARDALAFGDGRHALDLVVGTVQTDVGARRMRSTMPMPPIIGVMTSAGANTASTIGHGIVEVNAATTAAAVSAARNGDRRARLELPTRRRSGVDQERVAPALTIGKKAPMAPIATIPGSAARPERRWVQK